MKPGDEVIVGDYTFPATGHSVVWAGATPVFADVRPDIWTVDPSAVEAADHAAHRRHPRRRRLRTAGRLRRAARDRGPPRAVDHRGCRVLRRRVLQGPCRREPGRHRDLQLPRAQRHHRRRGRRAHDERRRARRSRPQAAHLRHRSRAEPARTAPTCRSRRSTKPDTTTGSPTSPPASCSRSWIGCRALVARRGAIAADVPRSGWSTSTASRLRSRSTIECTRGSRTSSRSTPRLDRGSVAQHLRANGVQCNFGTYASHLQPVYELLGFAARVGRSLRAAPGHSHACQSVGARRRTRRRSARRML